MFDSHMHTVLCHHAIGSPLEYAFSAIRQGFTGICFTEHMPLPNNANAHVRLRDDELLKYREMIYAARVMNAEELEVRCGLEMDFIPGIEAFSASLLEQYNWDYCIGSVHQVADLMYGVAPLAADLQAYWATYYDLVTQAAQTGLYNAIGHLDLPLRWTVAPDEHLELVLPVLDVIAKHGLALDFNTSGLRGEVGAPHPSAHILQAAFERGIPLVLGSDAHQPEHVGADFNQALSMARAVGYDSVLAFKEGKPESYSIIDMVLG